MNSLFWYLLAALGEIGGCFAFWAWLRLNRSPLLVVPGVVALVLFALALTRVQTAYAGRAFAAYGGIYMLGAVFWLWVKEGVQPDRWDLIGTAVSLAGTGLILFSPHKA